MQSLDPTVIAVATMVRIVLRCICGQGGVCAALPDMLTQFTCQKCGRTYSVMAAVTVRQK